MIDALRKEQSVPNADLKECSTGFDILDEIAGYETIFIVDAIKSNGEPGKIYRFSPEELTQKPTLHTFSSHEADFLTMLELGKQLFPDKMPEDITIVAIEAEDVMTISDRCTPRVEEAIPLAVELIKRSL